MNIGKFKLHNATYIALLICFSVIFFSLSFCAVYMLLPSFSDSETLAWLRLHYAEVFDTVAASVFLSLAGSLILELAHREK